MDRTTRHISKRMLLLGAALVVGAAVGVTSVSLASASSASNRSQQPAAVYPKDAKGLTYGSAVQANSPANEPDLIQVYATNGKTGYVYRTQLEPQSDPTSPAQAVAEQNARAAHAAVIKTIPVYASDGTTVIGSFSMSDEGPSTTK